MKRVFMLFFLLVSTISGVIMLVRRRAGMPVNVLRTLLESAVAVALLLWRPARPLAMGLGIWKGTKLVLSRLRLRPESGWNAVAAMAAGAVLGWIGSVAAEAIAVLCALAIGELIEEVRAERRSVNT